jgi:lambda repressor-like predicted transcriptional regulator
MGKHTSVWLPDDLVAALGKSGLSLREAVQKGLEAHGAMEPDPIGRLEREVAELRELIVGAGLSVPRAPRAPEAAGEAGPARRRAARGRKGARAPERPPEVSAAATDGGE